MLKNKLMLPILAVMVGVAASAFTVKDRGNGQEANLYWFNYTGDTQPTSQANSANYIYDKTTPSCNASTNNECYLQLSLSVAPTMNSHPDFSGGKVTTDPTSGIPDGGTTFSDNRTKN